MVELGRSIDEADGVVLDFLTFKCSDIKLSVYHLSCFISVCPFVALSKATFAETLHIVLSSTSSLLISVFPFHSTSLSPKPLQTKTVKCLEL